MNRVSRFLGPILIVVSFLPTAQPQSNKTSEKIPNMDGAAGPCSLELTVNSADGKPVYAATIKVHIAYGFAGTRRLDLEAGTNSEGKVKFTGLPARVHRPPLEFTALKDDLSGVATYDPSAECQAKHEIMLAKTQSQQAPD
jgi:hypothetical protein